MSRQIRAYVYSNLIDEVKKKYPETKGLSATGLVDWALRYLLKLNEHDYDKNVEVVRRKRK